MSITVYVPQDAVALGLGANRVARAIFAGAERRGLDVRIVRTGTRGLLWLEPMVEVATSEGRIAYGPVTPGDVEGLLDAGFVEGGAHALRLGKPEEIPFLAKQHRLTFHRCGVVDPGRRRGRRVPPPRAGASPQPPYARSRSGCAHARGRAPRGHGRPRRGPGPWRSSPDRPANSPWSAAR